MKLLDREDTACPWCGGVVSMGVLQVDADDAIPASEHCKDVVLHVEPTCAAWEAHSGDDFVEAAARESARRRASA